MRRERIRSFAPSVGPWPAGLDRSSASGCTGASCMGPGRGGERGAGATNFCGSGYVLARHCSSGCVLGCLLTILFSVRDAAVTWISSSSRICGFEFCDASCQCLDMAPPSERSFHQLKPLGDRVGQNCCLLGFVSHCEVSMRAFRSLRMQTLQRNRLLSQRYCLDCLFELVFCSA